MGMTEQQALKYLKDANRNNQMVGILPKSDIGKCLVNALEEVQQYRAIGTPDECRAAVEKQNANKIVRVKLRQSEWGSEYRCPVCESDLIKTVFFNEDGTEPDEKISWCSGCGQKLNWSENK